MFRLRIRKAPFLRKNHAVDLYKARKEVAHELARLIGEFRDYNGGTLSKESELFTQLEVSLGERGREHAFLLENFFYALSPPIMRSLLPVEPIKKLFTMILEEELEEEQPYAIRIEENAKYFYAIITSIDPNFHERLHLEPFEEELVTCLIPRGEVHHFGVLLRAPAPSTALALRGAIEEVMVSYA